MEHVCSNYNYWQVIFTRRSISHGVNPAKPAKRFFKSFRIRTSTRTVVCEAFSSNHLACRIVASAPSRSFTSTCFSASTSNKFFGKVVTRTLTRAPSLDVVLNPPSFACVGKSET